MKPNPQAPSDIILYQTDDGSTRLEVQLQAETVWLSQAQMVELFQTSKQNVSLHIQNIFREGELRENSVVKESLTTYDREVGDYVIVHELLHFFVPNHGKLWKSLMRVHLGDYETLDKRLKSRVAKRSK